MREDEEGLDTVLGALILILACLMASSALVSLDHTFVEAEQDIRDLEGKLDCVLSSTLELNYTVGGIEIERQVSVERYAIEVSNSISGDVVPPAQNVSGEISALMDFYFSGFDGWSLRLNCSTCDPIELASRGLMAADGGSTYILSRPLIGADGGKSSLEFTIFQ